MRKATLAALVSVVIAAGPAFAAGGGGGAGHGGGAHHGVRSSIPQHLPPHHHHNGFRAFGGAPFIGYGYGYGYGYGLAYDLPDADPPASYPADYSSYDASSMSYAPPMQRVVEFPSGRWVLQGDGMTLAYRWVWIPNPPPPPPSPPAAAAPPLVPEPVAAPVRNLDYYRWTDADGVIHLTDDIKQVPEPYRAKAKLRT